MKVRNLVNNSMDCDVESQRYLNELEIKITENRQKIQFNNNMDIPVHRWAPYILGFSQAFVFSYLQKFRKFFVDDNGPRVHDPFAGCGTVLVEAQKSGEWQATGTELNPLLAYVTKVKLGSWSIEPSKVWDTYLRMTFTSLADYPSFLDTERQFGEEILKNLRRIKADITAIEDETIRDIFNMAFAAILIDSSKLKRTPSLGYDSHKQNLPPRTPLVLFQQKIEQICEDLRYLQSFYPNAKNIQAQVYVEDAREYPQDKTHLVITSPPYMNGFDYVTNFKIEMAWLGFTTNFAESKALKDSMVACDNISKGATKDFASIKAKYTEPWLNEILERLRDNIKNWGVSNKSKRIQRKRRGEALVGYRRPDMPEVVHKYFDDMDKVMAKTAEGLVDNGRAIFVIGDSFIADTYIPTDLLIAKMATLHGLSIDSIERARVRHSGQIRNFKLRETIVTLRKDGNCQRV